MEGEADPEAALDALVEQWRMAHLLGRLPAEQADVLRRRFYGGRSQREIAAETGHPARDGQDAHGAGARPGSAS